MHHRLGEGTSSCRARWHFCSLLKNVLFAVREQIWLNPEEAVSSHRDALAAACAAVVPVDHWPHHAHSDDCLSFQTGEPRFTEPVTWTGLRSECGDAELKIMDSLTGWYITVLREKHPISNWRQLYSTWFWQLSDKITCSWEGEYLSKVSSMPASQLFFKCDEGGQAFSAFVSVLPLSSYSAHDPPDGELLIPWCLWMTEVLSPECR